MEESKSKVNKSIYKVSKFFMISVGLWKLPLAENSALQKFYDVYSTLVQGIYITYNVSLIIKGAQISFNHTDSQNVFGVASLAALIAEINFKIIVLIRNKVPHLFKHIINQEDKIRNSATDQDIVDSYKGQCRFYELTTRCQIITTVTSVYFYIVFNVYKKITDKLAPGENFMYELWFPFDVDGNGTVMMVCKLVLSQVGLLFNCGSQVIMQSLMVFISSNLHILQIRLRKMFSVAETNVTQHLSKLIEDHQFIIGFVEDLNNSINSIILLEFLLDSVNLAAALLQIITAQSIIEITFSLVYFVLLLSQLFILAWSANEIYTQSFNVSNAIYESNWMDQSEPIKKTMLIMLMRAQKPLALTIGPFRPMNMEAGLMTVKGAYTYAGVMRQKYT
uniref:Odorant receptor n=1 Tax=Eucryptorrhynchus scrobiculatus TaxID=1552824 RepID=A0A8F4N0L4_EUCSC|nr:odorant receptor 8 [Eucryptorrhynchus scrobiculatus]